MYVVRKYRIIHVFTLSWLVFRDSCLLLETWYQSSNHHWSIKIISKNDGIRRFNRLDENAAILPTAQQGQLDCLLPLSFFFLPFPKTMVCWWWGDAASIHQILGQRIQEWSYEKERCEGIFRRLQSHREWPQSLFWHSKNILFCKARLFMIVVDLFSSNKANNAS